MKQDAPRIVALDIGGSHLTAAVVDCGLCEIVEGTRSKRDVEEAVPTAAVLDRSPQAALQAVAAVGDEHVSVMGVVIPAPFVDDRGAR